MAFLDRFPVEAGFLSKPKLESLDPEPTVNIESKKPTYKPQKLIFSGEGSKVFNNQGAVHSLEEQNLLKYVNEVCGFSGGSIIALLVALKYSYAEISEKMKKYNSDIITDYQRFGDAELAYNFYKTRGLYSGNNISEWLESLIFDKINISNATFKDLKKKTGIILNIPLTNLNTSQLEIFNFKNQPDVVISTVVKAACNLSILYPPMNYNGNDYCDPILITGYQLTLWDELNQTDDSVLGFLPLSQVEEQMTDKEDRQPTDGLYNFTVSILETVVKSRLGVYTGDNFWDRTVPINYSEGLSYGVYSLIRGNLSDSDRNQLIENGYHAVSQFLLNKMQ